MSHRMTGYAKCTGCHVQNVRDGQNVQDAQDVLDIMHVHIQRTQRTRCIMAYTIENQT